MNLKSASLNLLFAAPLPLVGRQAFRGWMPRSRAKLFNKITLTLTEGNAQLIELTNHQLSKRQTSENQQYHRLS